MCHPSSLNSINLHSLCNFLGELSSPYPSWICIFCIEIDLQWLQVAKTAYFKAEFEKGNKAFCLKLSPRSCGMKVPFWERREFPTGPCLLIPADSSIVGAVPFWLPVIWGQPLTPGLSVLLRGMVYVCQTGDGICDIKLSQSQDRGSWAHVYSKWPPNHGWC